MKIVLKNISLLFLFSTTFCLQAQQVWKGELHLNKLECELKQACYTLALKGQTTEAWALGDQNYRLFFDAKNLSILSVTSLLPEDGYGQAQLNEVLEIEGEGQENYSPLDHFDSHLGFLDFSILAYAKEDMERAVLISNSAAIKVAEICVEVSDELLLEGGAEHAVNLYFSRAETAGQITNQYAVITEINEPNHTKATTAIGFSDINYEAGLNGQLGKLCQATSTDEETLFNDDLTLYPNPYRHQEALNYESELANGAAHEVRITDAQGRQLLQWEDLPKGNQQIILQDKLPQGAYLFHLISKEKQLIQKLMIMN